MRPMMLRFLGGLATVALPNNVL